MGTENVHTLFDRFKTNFKKSNRFIHFLNVNLVAWLKLFVFRNVLVAFLFGHFDNLLNAFALSFTII